MSVVQIFLKIDIFFSPFYFLQRKKLLSVVSDMHVVTKINPIVVQLKVKFFYFSSAFRLFLFPRTVMMKKVRVYEC